MSATNRDLGYPIVVGTSTKRCVRDALRDRRFVVLCDAQSAVRRYARAVVPSGASCLGVRAVALGERRKRLRTVEAVLEMLVACGADRGTIVVGVGGGVANDLFGYAASAFMRGVPYVHVATSLVAMVDASIGGKTGVDLASGKNLAGSFTDPRAVICAVDALDTLPYRQIREGLAEVVKHGVISGGDLFDALEHLAAHDFTRWPWEAVVEESVRVKTSIVARDRTERSHREVLNLGHTFAHGFERASEYRISHGAAVAIGLRAAGLLGIGLGTFSESDHLRILTLLALLRLPMHAALAPRRVFAAMQADKKKRGGKLRFVVPRAIGDIAFGIGVPDRLLARVLDDVSRPPGADRL